MNFKTVGEEMELDAVPTSKRMKENIVPKETATSMDNLLTKNLERNVKEIEEERKLLRALVKTSNSVAESEKLNSRKNTSAEVASKNISPISNNIIRDHNNPSRVTQFSKSCK